MKNISLTDLGVIYDGEFYDGQFHGNGTMLYPNGNRIIVTSVNGSVQTMKLLYADETEFDINDKEYVAELYVLQFTSSFLSHSNLIILFPYTIVNNALTMIALLLQTKFSSVVVSEMIFQQDVMILWMDIIIPKANVFMTKNTLKLY